MINDHEASGSSGDEHWSYTGHDTEEVRDLSKCLAKEMSLGYHDPSGLPGRSVLLDPSRSPGRPKRELGPMRRKLFLAFRSSRAVRRRERRRNRPIEMRNASRLHISRDVFVETNTFIPESSKHTNSEDGIKHFTVTAMIAATVWVQPTGADPKVFFKELGKYLGVRDKDIDAYDALVPRLRPILEEIVALQGARDRVRDCTKNKKMYLRCEGGGSYDLSRRTPNFWIKFRRAALSNASLLEGRKTSLFHSPPCGRDATQEGAEEAAEAAEEGEDVA